MQYVQVTTAEWEESRAYPEELPVVAHEDADEILAVASLRHGHVAPVLGESHPCHRTD